MAHNVLVVEDDDASRTLLFAVLSGQSIRCDGAREGADAIVKLRQNKYCAILLDLMLPEVNGFEVLRFLRAEHAGDVRRVIVVTAACDTTLRDFDSAGTFDVLRKPYDIGEVREITQRCAEQCGYDHHVAKTDEPEPWSGETTPSKAPHQSH